MSSNFDFDDYLFYCLQIIKTVMPLYYLKSLLITLFVIILIASVIYFIYSSIQSHLKTMYSLYKCVSNTFKSVSNKIINTVGMVNPVESFKLDIEAKNKKKSAFSFVSISNNAHDKQVDINLSGLKVPNGEPVSIGSYISEKKLGFYFHNDPGTCYTANSKKFRSKWNNSIYSNLYTIPDFVPENLNYSKISSFFSYDNLTKGFVALSMGKFSPNVKEFINNVKVTKPKKFILPGSDYLQVTVSKDYLQKLCLDFKKSVDNAHFDFIKSYVAEIVCFLDSSRDKNIVIDFVLSHGMVKSAETSFEKNGSMVNVCLTFDESEITVSIKDLSQPFPDANEYTFKVLFSSEEGVKTFFANRDTVIISVDIKKTSGLSVILNLSYLSEEPASYIITLSDKAGPLYTTETTKNIYSLSVSELLELIKQIRGMENYM